MIRAIVVGYAAILVLIFRYPWVFADLKHPGLLAHDIAVRYLKWRGSK